MTILRGMKLPKIGVTSPPSKGSIFLLTGFEDRLLAGSSRTECLARQDHASDLMKLLML